MPFEISFPEPKPKVIVETPFMMEVMDAVMNNQLTGNMSCWYGNSGIGKTTLAEHLEMKINEAFSKNQINPNAFRAKHYQVAENTEGGSEQKQGIKSVYVAMGVTLAEGDYRFRQAHELADDAVDIARRKRIKVFFVDEAGNLSINTIRGIVTIRDRSLKMGWPISFIFIGMDDLPQKLVTVPQIRRRVHPWVFFEQYSFDDTWDLLSKLNSYFSTLDRENKEHVAQVKFVYETFGGYSGSIIPFLTDLDSAMKAIKGMVDEKFLRSVHYLMTYSKDKTLEKSESLHRTRPPRTADQRRRR
jgi:AAA domain